MSEVSNTEYLRGLGIFTHLSDEQIDALAAAAEVRHFDFGDSVCNAGDPADGLYVIRQGAVRIFTEEEGKEISMGVRKEGEVFAEVAMLRALVHESSVRASAKTELLYIPTTAFEPVLAANAEARGYLANYVAIASVGGFVSRLFRLRGKVDSDEFENLIKSAGIKRVRKGRTIVEQNDTDDRRLYIIRQGLVSLSHQEGKTDYPLGSLGPGEIVGERACLMRQQQPATVTAETDVVLLVIPERSVALLLEHNPKLREVLLERIQFAERDLQRQKTLQEKRSRPLLMDLASRPTRDAKLIKRFQLIQQAEEMDCGAACLAMICRHYGINMTLGKLREMANVTREGATLESLARVGRVTGIHDARRAVHLRIPARFRAAADRALGRLPLHHHLRRFQEPRVGRRHRAPVSAR